MKRAAPPPPAPASPTAKPYGEWSSPITSESLTQASVGLSGVAVDMKSVYWQESRPGDSGRTALVAAPWDDLSAAVDVVKTAGDAGLSVGSRVHEYGGGAFVVADELSAVYFVNLKDQRVWRVQQEADGAWGEPSPLTTPSDGGSSRFADFAYDRTAARLICVRETHAAGVKEAVSEIVAVDVATGVERVVATGRDFYSSPRLSADGRLAFVAWDHPAMPWDATGVYQGDLAGSSASESVLENVQCVSGGAGYGEEGCVSAMQPTYDGADLYYVSDVSGWWSIYRTSRRSPAGELVFGGPGREVGGPAWMFGAQAYRFFQTESSRFMFVQYSDVTKAGTQATVLELGGAGRVVHLDLSPFTDVAGVQITRAPGGNRNVFRVACVGGASTMHAAVAVTELDAGDGRKLRLTGWTFVKRSSVSELDTAVLSVPRVISFPTTDGSATAYMNYYPPTNARFEAPKDGSPPPLLVKSHGGPTSRASTAYSGKIQYFTSRGFAVADVNYSGSSGFGTAYRQRLVGRWGVADVDDCAQAALHLAELGLVDRNRMAISGGSAGGYTTLACLCWKSDVFAAAASLYGVADLNLLAAETHKFESRYLDSLVGPYAECKALYDERSPVNSVHLIKAPLIQFQGLLDQVVPPTQARAMHNALTASGVRSCLVEFEEERHGFRSGDAIRRSVDGELWWYGTVLGFKPDLGNDEFLPPTVG
jgi:dipeptidyl aminopeptidase/acylaminoacyl peptidase